MEQISPQLLEKQRQEIKKIADDASAEINQAIVLVQAAQKQFNVSQADRNGLYEIELSLKDLLGDMWNRSNKRALTNS